jgi:hypothetical protein
MSDMLKQQGKIDEKGRRIDEAAQRRFPALFGSVAGLPLQ